MPSHACSMPHSGARGTTPLVSVAITAYNVASFLDEALAGVISQSYRPMEVVVYDDASSDGSLKILHRFRESAEIPVTVLAGSENAGASTALIRAIEACHGKYVAILDGDDIWLPGKLAAQVQWLEEGPARVMCGHDVECFESATGKVLWTASGSGLLRSGRGAARSVRDGPIFPTSAIMLRRGAVPPHLNHLNLARYTDWNMWSDCLAAGGAYGYVPGTYSRYRRNPGGWVARHANSIKSTATILESGTAWLGSFEARYPQYHAACRYRRSALLANHGRYLFERGHRRLARKYLLASLPGYGWSAWKAVGLLLVTSVPPSISARTYRILNGWRLTLRYRAQRDDGEPPSEALTKAEASRHR